MISILPPQQTQSVECHFDYILPQNTTQTSSKKQYNSLPAMARWWLSLNFYNWWSSLLSRHLGGLMLSSELLDLADQIMHIHHLLSKGHGPRTQTSLTPANYLPSFKKFCQVIYNRQIMISNNRHWLKGPAAESSVSYQR